MKAIIKYHRSVPLVSTLDIYEALGVKHVTIIKLIKKYETTFQGIRAFEFIKTVKNHKGRPAYYCYLDEAQVMLLLAISRNNNNNIKSIMLFIDCFKKAKNGIQSFIEALQDFDFDDMVDRYVYAAIDSQNRVKIGISNDPERRLKELNIGNADTLELIFTKKATGTGYSDEIELHNSAKEFHIRSEWFTKEARELLV